MTFTIKEVTMIAAFCAGISGAWAVTIYKVDQFESRLERVEGNVQFLLGAYIRDGSGQIPLVPWHREPDP